MNNISFKGFNNILCAQDISLVGQNTSFPSKKVSYIAMRLNNEKDMEIPNEQLFNFNDLDNYTKLREMQGYRTDIVDDTIILAHVIDNVNKSDNLYLGTKDMYFGEELLQLEQKYVPKVMSYSDYKRENAIHMKAYTLLASITKRMMNRNCDINNSEITKVMNKIIMSFGNIEKNKKQLFSQAEVFKLLQIGSLKTFNFRKVASFFNKGIVHTMGQFFK